MTSEPSASQTARHGRCTTYLLSYTALVLSVAEATNGATDPNTENPKSDQYARVYQNILLIFFRFGRV